MYSPMIQPPSGEARKATTEAMSAGLPNRRSVVSASIRDVWRGPCARSVFASAGPRSRGAGRGRRGSELAHRGQVASLPQATVHDAQLLDGRGPGQRSYR